MQDVELKTKVTEQVHDDFVVLSRMMGFNHKAECIRFLIERELYGNLTRLQHRPMGTIPKGPSDG